jgi:transketolase
MTAFVDDNGLQISGRTVEVMNMEPIGTRFAAFGWATKDIDGNDMSQVVDALESLPLEKGRPSAIIARTVKSKGLSFAEGIVAYHYWKPNDEELTAAERELDEAIRFKEAP